MHNTFSTYTQVCRFLEDLGLFHMDLSLDRMQNALKKLQLTHFSFYSVHIVGTNGKGSTATFLERLAREHGLRTGLFTSPHFISPKERICINGQPLAEEKWPSLAQKVHDAAPNLTYFEFLTIFAALAFTQENIDFAVFEAGLGGHYDATTALHRHAVCITPISLDHQHVLGNTLEAIAKDKAEAIVANSPVFMGKQSPEVVKIIEEKCLSRHASLHTLTEELLAEQKQYALHLQGAHQRQNAAVACMAWQHIAQENSYTICQEKIENSLKKAFISGRLHYISCHENTLPPQILLDGAHNEAGLQELVTFIDTCQKKPAIIIFSCLADKDQVAMLHHLKNLHGLCQHCPLLITGLEHNERAPNTNQRQDMAHLLGKNTLVFTTIHDALLYARDFILQNSPDSGPVLVCGSLYLLGEFYEKYPHYLRKR